jgi:DNA-binding transcriptional ArsR family regulator
MLESLITSETKIKLLLKFFLNPEMTGYLRQLSREFSESTNALRIELNKLTQANIIEATFEGRNKIYKANKKHPLFKDIRSIVLKSTGIDVVVSNILKKLGPVSLAFIRGDYAKGIDSGLIDLVIVSNSLNLEELERVRNKTEGLIRRKISVLVLRSEEFRQLKKRMMEQPCLTLIGSIENIA